MFFHSTLGKNIYSQLCLSQSRIISRIIAKVEGQFKSSFLYFLLFWPQISRIFSKSKLFLQSQWIRLRQSWLYCRKWNELTFNNTYFCYHLTALAWSDLREELIYERFCDSPIQVPDISGDIKWKGINNQAILGSYTHNQKDTMAPNKLSKKKTCSSLKAYLGTALKLQIYMYVSFVQESIGIFH